MHFRFLTKEIVEEKLRDIRDEPNLYDNRHQLTNTDTLDKKYKEYLEKSKEINDIQLSILNQPLSHLFLKTIHPSLKDNENLNTDGLELKHADNLLGVPGDYSYTGSIQNNTDSGVFVRETGNVIYSFAFPSEDFRLICDADNQKGLMKIFKAYLKPIDGDYKKIEGSVVLTRHSDLYERVEKYLHPGLPNFVLMKFKTAEKNSHIYGDFIISVEDFNIYCQRAVEVHYEDREATRAIEKHVGEYIQNFFSKAYVLKYEENGNTFIKYEQNEPNKHSKWLIYHTHRVEKAWNLTTAEFDRLGLGEIKNNSKANLSEFKYYGVSDLPQTAGGHFSTKFSLFHDILPIEFLNYGQKSQGRHKSIGTIDFESPEEQLNLDRIKERCQAFRESVSRSQSSLLRTRGMKVEDVDESEAVYEGQFVGSEMSGYGHHKIVGGSNFVGKFADNKLVEGTLTLAGGSKYIGKFLNSSLHDENGRIEIPGVVVYEGNVEASFPQGKGKMTYLHLGRTYEGDFVKTDFDGFGKFSFETGDVVSGEFKNGVVDGEAELVRVNGDVYSGRIKQKIKLETEFEVEGKLVRAEGGVKEGIFSVDLRDRRDGSGGAGGSGGGSGAGPSGSEGGNSGGALKMTDLGELGYFGSFGWPLLSQFGLFPIHGFLVLEKERLNYLLDDYDDLAQFESRIKKRTSSLFSKNLDSASFSFAKKFGSKRNESITARRINLLHSNLWKQKFLPKSSTFFRLARKVF